MSFSNSMFLLVFLFLGCALVMTVASLRFANYQVALEHRRRVAAVWKPFWMSAGRRG